MTNAYRHPWFVLALALLSATGCKLGPDYHPPEPVLPATWSEPAGAHVAQGDDWWQAFGDPELSALVQRALHSSPDLRAAVARLRAARAQRGIVDAALLPRVGVSGSYSNSRLSENGFLKGFDSSSGLPGAIAPGQQINLEQVSLDAAWELDLFGRGAREREQAQAELEQELYSLDDVLVALVAEVADGYLELCGLHERLALAHENEDSLRAALDVVRERNQAGLGEDLELAHAESVLAEARAQVPELESAAHVAEHRLETLVGVVPGTLASELATTRPVPAAPPALDAGIPSDLLRRRPDVRVAERKLAAASAASNVERADLLPRFSLTGSFGVQSQSLDQLLSWDSRFWEIGPSVRWPLLDFGRRKYAIAVRDAEVEEAQAEYDRTLLSALSDVESALARLARAEVRRAALADAERYSARAEALADELYQSGLFEFLVRLQAERAHQATQDNEVLGRVAEARDAVALFRALGGGWEAGRAELEPAPEVVAEN